MGDHKQRLNFLQNLMLVQKWTGINNVNFYLILFFYFIEKKMTYVDLLNHTDYEILNEYPFTIRKKANGKVISEFDNGWGYPRIKLNGKPYLKHRLIALQFLPNSDPALFNEVDHVNRNRTDYHLKNLRWVSSSENQKNKSSHNGVEYEYLDDENLPDDLIIVNDYRNHRFEEYYYSESMDRFMFYNGVKTRLLHINYNNNGSAFVYCNDINGKRVQVCYSKFKKIYGLR